MNIAQAATDASNLPWSAVIGGLITLLLALIYMGLRGFRAEMRSGLSNLNTKLDGMNTRLANVELDIRAIHGRLMDPVGDKK
jgi:hypothetical protein